MNHDEVISKLKDIHWPNEPSWWPLALGYYIIALVLAALLALALKYFFDRRKRQLRRAIYQEFLAIVAHFRSFGDAASLQGSLAALLRRLVFLKSPESKKDAQLSDLTPILNKILPDQKKTNAIILLLDQDRFKPNPAIDAEMLINLAQRQIKRCRI